MQDDNASWIRLVLPAPLRVLVLVVQSQRDDRQRDASYNRQGPRQSLGQRWQMKVKFAQNHSQFGGKFRTI